MEERVRGIRGRVIQERKSAGFIRFTRALRSEVISLMRESGWSTVEVARQVSLSASTVQKWTKTPSFLEVTPSQKQQGSGGSERKGSFEVVFPGGARVSGLGLPELRALLGVGK